MRKLTIIALTLMVAMVAVPAFAAVQNVRVSGSVDSTYINRSHFDLQDGNTDEQSVFITQATLQVDADLTDQVSATVAVINERPWENSVGSGVSDISIYKAFVVIREMLYSPLTFSAGRFTGDEWYHGNSFIFNAGGANTSAVGDSGIQSVAQDLTKQSGLDAVRLNFDWSPFKLEAFAAVNDTNSNTIDDVDDDNFIYGLVGTYELGDEMDSLVEGYFYSRKNKAPHTINTPGQKTDHLKIVGGRVSTNILDGLNVQGEIAHQSGTNANVRLANGNLANQTRDAWGFQGIAVWQVPSFEEYNPVFTYAFTKVYGDKAGDTDDEFTGWDPFFESQAGGTIYNSLFNLSNAIIHTASLTVNPMEDVTSTLQFTKLWTHQDTVALSGQNDLTLLQPDNNNVAFECSNGTLVCGENGVGIEIDLITTYDYTEDVQFGLNMGIFKPKDIIGVNDSAKQILANVNVVF